MCSMPVATGDARKMIENWLSKLSAGCLERIYSASTSLFAPEEVYCGSMAHGVTPHVAFASGGRFIRSPSIA